jgi:hypothetical protein
MQRVRVPLLEYEPECPVLIVAETRQPANQGFGARTTFLMWAADVALRLRAVLAVEDRYWARGGSRAYHFGNSFDWSWQLFPFRNASYALRPGVLPAGMKVRRGTLTIDELLKVWDCNTAYKVQAGKTFSYDRLPGALDRGLTTVTNAPTPQLRSLWKEPNASQEVLAVWHMRTGDIVLPLRAEAAIHIKKLIDASFPRRGVRHVLLTYQSTHLSKSMPWLLSALGIAEIMDHSSLDDYRAFQMMLNADVLVSTGSSFPHIPAGLALAGRQLHLLLPPKGVVELRGEGAGTICCIVDSCYCEVPAEQLTQPEHQPSHNSGGRRLDCAKEASERAMLPRQQHKNHSAAATRSIFMYRTRTHGYWTGSFIRRNTVPVACDGKIFPEYRYKLRELARHIDEGIRARAEIAELSYEGFVG